MGVLAIILGRKALKEAQPGGERPGGAKVAFVMILVSALIAMATMGMTGWECYISSHYSTTTW